MSGPATSSRISRPCRRPEVPIASRAERSPLPRISAFYGIVIGMHYNDHAPPHFHAAYGGHEAKILILTVRVLAGSLPPRALRMVRKWVGLHSGELLANWRRARELQPLAKIEPLP